MKVVIVEDDFIVADHLQLILRKHGINVLKIADNVNDALSAQALKPDLYFVDIRLVGEKTGIDLGIELHSLHIPFIYVTANNEITTLRRAAKSAPMAYITKPYKESDIIALIEILRTHNEQTIAVKTKFGKKPIKLSDILYFHSNGSYLEIVTEKDKYVERNSLSLIEGLFADRFIRVHRSYLVNKEHIEQYNSKYIYIKEEAIPISRNYKEMVKEVLN